MSADMLDKSYDPHAVEERWYAFWEEQGLFEAKETSLAPSYSIVIPPPNVTGVLHMGHALNNTLQDILCRYRRLRGDNVLWMPGTDHAGIATQNVVEKKLAEQGMDRHRMGREKFIEAVWEWREKYGGAIIHQLKRLGASCDWKRERFTMDEGLSRAVRKVFVTLYHEGLIYRGDYIINWCPRCRTALADLEVEHETHDGHLYHIRYPAETGQGGLVIATTRPETMLGDTAVAVNPEDERYQNLSFEAVVLPLVGRVLPVIKENYVDQSFGTGALKITPAHDPNDFEIGLRHHLPSVKVLADDGTMNSEAGRFAGMERFACRKAVVEALKKEGFLEKVEPYQHAIGHCYRCQTLVEPNLSRQWFVRTKPLAEKAIEAVASGKTRIIPEAWTRTYYDWMHNIRDWCISRQIWWGHQIPAWTCAACDTVTVAMDSPDACPACGSSQIVQETDVLDTWFSSALWPFSTMGWPEETPLLKTFYPTSVLVTGFDILFFWVARMMMMGIHFMKDVPFHDVYVHALVRDEAGKKMSKSSGNVIDPIEIIDRYGTDAFRFTLAAFAAQGRDVKMSEKRVEGYRHFMNKLWNAARFCLMHLEPQQRAHSPQQAAGNASESKIGKIPHGGDSPLLVQGELQKESAVPDPEALDLYDRWILSRKNTVAKEMAEALEAYRFNDAAGILYQFVWHEFCDWYIEIVKPILYGKAHDNKKENTLAVLGRVLKDLLILLHPFAPFISEEVWHKLPGTEHSIMTARFPEDAFSDPVAERRMTRLMEIVSGIRNVRGEMGLPPSVPLDVAILVQDADLKDFLIEHEEILIHLAKLKGLSLPADGAKPKKAATTVVDGATIYTLLEGVVDFSKEEKRLEKEIGKLADELTAVSSKLNNEDFLRKAPSDVVKKAEEKRELLALRRTKLETNLKRLQEMGH
ncbi:MAG: valine--tRNA ligase [Deltaproteobacteria bacterium]|nr:valine--tRNA ligase [Deltaproteobacteria bacterium]